MAIPVRRPSLEPLLPAVVLLGLAHLFLGGGVVWLLLARSSPPQGVEGSTWRPPSSFLVAPASPAATASAPAAGAASVSGAPAAQPAIAPTSTLASKPVASSPPAPALTVLKLDEIKAPAPAAASPAPTSGLATVSTPATLSPPAAPPASPMNTAPVQAAAPALGGVPNKQEAVAAPGVDPLARVMESAPPAPESTADEGTLPIPPMPAVAGSTKAADKYITLSAVQPLAPGQGAGLAAVNQAIQQAVLQAWTPPPLAVVPPGRRQATAQIGVESSGLVTGWQLVQPSGSPEMDASVLDAVRKVPKIPATLPSPFAKERYDVRVNFLIE